MIEITSQVPVELSLVAPRMNPQVFVDSKSNILVVAGGIGMGGIPAIEIEIYDSVSLKLVRVLN